MTTIRDKLWMWGHEPGTHDHQYGLPGTSRMTPAEAAYYLHVPNLLMIGIGNCPAPPFDQHMISFRPLKRVIWSIVGDSSSTRTDLDEVVRLAEKFPNLVGAVMDDFFHAPNEQGVCSRVSIDDLQRFRARLQGAARPLELWVTLYAHDFAFPIQDHLALCDAITFWTWTADQLPQLETNFQQLEEFAPEPKKVLGCYMWDYGASKEMPVQAMEHQCELGLRWLQEGRLDGMIFLSNSACDQETKAVEWTRRWIEQAGDREL